MDVRENGEFRNRLVALAELFDVKLSPQRQTLYFEGLRDLLFDRVVCALNAAVRACTFMPKPAELRALAIGDDESHTERAWLAFRHAMRAAGAYASLATDDPALGETIIAVFGGWPSACQTDLSPEMWASKRKEFGRVYRVFRDRQLTGSRYLLGVCEQQNAGRLEWLRYIHVAVLDGAGVRLLRGDQAETYRQPLADVSSSGRDQLAAGFVAVEKAKDTA